MRLLTELMKDIMNSWIEIITIVWAFCMSIILGSYILCGV